MSEDADGRVMCPHCNQSIAERTYWLHKRHFNDSGRDQWLKDDDITYSDSDDTTVDLHSCSDDRGFLLRKSDNDNEEQDEMQENVSFISLQTSAVHWPLLHVPITKYKINKHQTVLTHI